MKFLVSACHHYENYYPALTGIFDNRELAEQAIKATGVDAEPDVDREVFGFDFARLINGQMVYFWIYDVPENGLDLERIS